MADPTNRVSLVAGIFFLVAGGIFLLEHLGVLELELRVLAPLMLIAIGLAILLGGRGSRTSA